MKTAFGHTTHDQALSVRKAPLGVCALFVAALSLVVAVLLSVFLLATPTPASAEDGLFAGGTGSETDPYQIANADQLKNLADQVNAGSAQYATAHYALTANIDLADSKFTSTNARIGYADNFKHASTHGFRGTFDGRGFTIRNLTLDLSKLTFTGSMYTAGLFGATQDATIRNLNLQSVTLSETLPSTVVSDKGADAALGCLVGAAYGSTTIEKCSVMGGSLYEGTVVAPTDNIKTRLYAAGGLVGDAYTTDIGKNASITNCSVDCTIQTTGTYSSQSYAGGIVGRSRVNSNDGGWSPAQVNSCAFTGSIKADGYNAPVIAGVRRGADGAVATGTNISTAVTFDTCFYQAQLSMNDGTRPNPLYNLTQSNDVSNDYVYDESGVYRWGDDKQSGYYDDTTIVDCKAKLDPTGKTWRQASKNGVPILVLNHVSMEITLDEPLHGRYYLSEVYSGLYEGEVGVSPENPVWSANVSVTTDGRHFVTLAPEAQEASVTFGPDSNRQQASCVIPAPSDVSVAVQRVNNNAGRVVSLTAVIVNGDAWGLSTDDFTYEWFEGSEVSGVVVSTASSLDVSSAPVGTKFTVKATLKANSALTFKATGTAGGRTVFVNANTGSDSAKGSSPDDAVATIPKAYELLDELGTVESNVIVIVGEYNDSSFGLEQEDSKWNAFYKPATITGYDAGYPEASKGTNSLKDSDARFNNYGRLAWHNDEERGKFLYADTAIRDIVLYGGGGKVGYIYCQGHNLTMGENIKMYGYSQASVDNFGLLTDTSVPNFHIVGGYYDKADSETGQDPGDECTITVKSGCYARILAGNRNSKMNAGSHNTLGSENNNNYFKTKIVVDIQQTSCGGYNCDVGMLCGGQTDGSVYAASEVVLNSGYVKLFLGSSIGYNRSTGDNRYPNNDFVGLVRATVNGGTVDQLYGGCLGRWSDKGDKSIGIDSHYRHSEAIRGGLDPSDPDILITINGGTVGTNDATGAVFASGAGGTTGTAEDPASVAVVVNGGTIKGSVYGGGDGKTTTGNADTACATAGTLYGTANVTVAGGTITGSVYGGGAGTDAYLANADKHALAQVIGDTTVSVTGGTVNGSVYGGGNGIERKDTPHMARVTGNTCVSVSGGQVGGSVYGGGARGTVGEGTVGGNGRLPYEVTSAGSTTVEVSGGTVAGSVFGGGEGFGQGDSNEALIKGAVFGTSTVKVYGGSIKDDVFGGGNESRTYAPAVDGAATQATLVIVNSTNEGIAVLPETDAQDAGKVVSNGTEGARIVDNPGEEAAASRTVDLGGSVFGGGNRSKQSGSGQANDYTVYGDTEVFVKGSGVNFGGESGGVYGDGNVSKAFGTRHITLIDFKNDASGADALKKFYSLQRADRAIMSNSKVYTLGALDRVNSLDSTKYAVNRVQLLKLYNGSTLQLDTVVNGLGSLWSDVETGRDFRTDDWKKENHDGHKYKELKAYRQAYETSASWKSAVSGTEYQALNTIIINNGKQLDVAYADDEQPETGKYGHVIGLFTLSLLTPEQNEGGAFVFAATGTDTQAVNPDSTGHFACVTKEYEDGKEEEDDYLDLRTQQLNGNRIWYVEGHTYQYDLTIKGYTTGNTTVTAQAWLPVNEREDDDKGKDCYLQFDESKAITIENTPELVGEGVTPGEKQAQLRMDVNTEAGGKWGGHYYFQNPGHGPDKQFGYNEKVNLIPVTFSLTLGQNMIAVNDGLVTFQLKDMNEDDDMNTYLFRVHIIIESPTSDGYALKHYGKIYGDVPYTTNDTITSKSAYTAEFISTYSPSAYSGKSWSIIPYWTASAAKEYRGHGDEKYNSGSDYFEKGTKITMIDLTNGNSPQYYYYNCDSNIREINLDDFNKVNGSSNFSSTKSGNTVIREKLVFIVDYENASIGGGRPNQYLMLKHTYNNGANDILRYTEYHQDGTVANEHYAPGVEQLVDLDSQFAYSAVDTSSINLKAMKAETTLDYLYDSYQFAYSFKLKDNIIDTRLNDNDFSLLLTPMSLDSFPLGMRFVVTDTDGNSVPVRYIQENGVRVVADIEKPGTYLIEMQFSRYLNYGWYNKWYLQLRADLFSAADGLYYKGTPGQVDSNRSANAQFTNLTPYSPNIVYNLSVNSVVASGNNVTANLSAFKEAEQSQIIDLAATNGVVAFRQLKGNPSTLVNLTSEVQPQEGAILESKANGKKSKTTTFTLTDTVPGPGTYEYTFFYGTTVETKTVTVG